MIPLIHKDEANEVDVQAFERLLQEEREDLPVCARKIRKEDGSVGDCETPLKLDVVTAKFFCPHCDIQNSNFSRHVDSNSMLMGTDYFIMRRMPREALIRVLRIRDTRFNSLYHEWQKALVGDRKTEFFLERLREMQSENELLRSSFWKSRLDSDDLLRVFRHECSCEVCVELRKVLEK